MGFLKDVYWVLLLGLALCFLFFVSQLGCLSFCLPFFLVMPFQKTCFLVFLLRFPFGLPPVRKKCLPWDLQGLVFSRLVILPGLLKGCFLDFASWAYSLSSLYFLLLLKNNVFFSCLFQKMIIGSFFLGKAYFYYSYKHL